VIPIFVQNGEGYRSASEGRKGLPLKVGWWAGYFAPLVIAKTSTAKYNVEKYIYKLDNNINEINCHP
jgi:hypothetical protein